ncbi:NAD(P)(+) transhydrogenase (Re/Si-specific) subunit beta [Candidatus Methylacidithermus pantelleriae]|uniref:NAD(P) transhydrogenase subunit beta n=1 Tax=Candidatus Methylacidithermus pantelleriae TaxID=2744239 RepID=A0A8J2BHA3_9BACT|nr:NAD(P)(+) transhydrogenase (Re/Si-specific) subunit beta [Candidatus Methylacidithermus pantelleriae]CAF0689420.1 pyridine nucleotide transhydrogenase subunit beta [Candidatus Methylacidithermus pantelleriae]
MESPGIELAYVVASALFILSLKWMSEVRTARLGNLAGCLGMALAMVATLAKPQIQHFPPILIGLVVGTLAGVPMALLMPMTAVPQRTALSHAFGALAAGLVGTAEYLLRMTEIPRPVMAILVLEVLLGYLTFTGSLVAFGKLQGLVPGQPIVYPGRNVVSLAVFSLAILSGVGLVAEPRWSWLFSLLVFAALGFGILLVLPIGGADMPTVIAILNAYAGLSSSFMGFALNNKLLIVAGALDGSSGFILSILMCKAMNRSFTNVLFGAVGQVLEQPKAEKEGRAVQSFTPQDVATVLENARLVMIVPGYGMAAAQAQHAVKELADALAARHIEVRYAIHPVAGRMPGHMNVLLAEAQVPYDQLLEMDLANPLFPEADVAIVIGANDITNPAARTRKDSPLYGMPILEVDKARTVVFVKRSMATGFAGVDNDLFYLPKTMMVFGDAKKVVTEITAALKSR